ncbi:tyrosine-type recombinase/integrase [Dietzia timorensis]|uniref:Tyr recombinase domain-containing protein n=1 Tax=Dietzia timorensis TaxID=499555 RepID=A0A173LJB1_9ACTN|nr:tyrosine-type recombinase/integrase [Dietzia timorensis]ANI91357.1 Hypothetical protein BJL86_0554 [Dietzia timorensis]
MSRDDRRKYFVVYTSKKPKAVAAAAKQVRIRQMPVRDVDGLPVIVDQFGRPETTFLGFILTYSSLSKNTLEQYGNALARFANFMSATFCEIPAKATASQIDLYKRTRLHLQSKPIQPISFKPEAAVLRNYFLWLEQSNLIEKSPILRTSRAGTDLLHVRAIGQNRVRYVSKEAFRKFIDSAEGSNRIHNLRRADLRNVAVIKTLVSAGMRLQEVSTLLSCEVDTAVRRSQVWEFDIQAAAKNGKRRTIYLDIYALRAIEKYRKIERRHIVKSNQERFRDHLDELFVVESIDPKSGMVSGSWGMSGPHLKYEIRSTPVDIRRKIVSINKHGFVEPLALFLSQSRGLPMSRSGWEQVFRKISEQAFFGKEYYSEPHISPHDLRHTFAINYLRYRYAQMVTQEQEDLAHPLLDPLVDLQEILGHSSMAQTMRYLRLLNKLDEGVAASLKSYVGELYGEEK